MDSLKRLLAQVGLLRGVLAVLALIAIGFAPAPGIQAVRAGWALVPTMIIPVMGPLVFMGLLLDATMCRIWMSDAGTADKRRYRIIAWLELLLAVVLLLSWLPFILV